jgi:hypothetical protein
MLPSTELRCFKIKSQFSYTPAPSRNSTGTSRTRAIADILSAEGIEPALSLSTTDLLKLASESNWLTGKDRELQMSSMRSAMTSGVFISAPPKQPDKIIPQIQGFILDFPEFRDYTNTNSKQ